jgi:membrane-associated phospholipid phosphatase
VRFDGEGVDPTWMLDPLVVAIALGMLGATIAGPALGWGLRRLSHDSRRRTEWTLIAGALVVALFAEPLLRSPVGGTFVYLLAALPGLVAFLAFRTLLASTLVSLAPLYFVIANLTQTWPTYAPETAFDRAIPLRSEWMLVYGSLYVFVIVLPLLVVRQPDLLRRAMQGYLLVMIVAYTGFLLYPTAAPRPVSLPVDGFSSWVLAIAYAVDPPYGCFPSLHVAYAFVSAFACGRVHRGVGVVALLWAGLIGVSTLYTKQHYVVDVVAGASAAGIAYVWFLRGYPREAVTDGDRRLAPYRALGAAAFFAFIALAFWVTYASGTAIRI